MYSGKIDKSVTVFTGGLKNDHDHNYITTRSYAKWNDRENITMTKKYYVDIISEPMENEDFNPWGDKNIPMNGTDGM